jgi:hypothetical protein
MKPNRVRPEAQALVAGVVLGAACKRAAQGCQRRVPFWAGLWALAVVTSGQKMQDQNLP